MRKRDLLSKQRQEYIQQQFSRSKTDIHSIKFEKNGDLFFSTKEGLQYINNRNKIYFICEICGEEKKINKESYKNNICHACKHKAEVTGKMPEHIIDLENKVAKCKLCGKDFSFEEMCSHKGKRFGVDNICKGCNTQKSKEYNKKHPESKRKMDKKYREKNKEKLKEKDRNYYLKNKEERLLKAKKYYSENTEQVKLRIANYIKTPTGKTVKINSSSKRRTKEKRGFIETDELIKLKNDTKVCEFCGIILDEKNTHLDHIIPLSIGGAHRIENVRYICSSCNLARPRDGKDVMNLFENLEYTFSLEERIREIDTIMNYNKDHLGTSFLNKNVITFQENIFYAKEKELWKNYEIKKKILSNRSHYIDKRLNKLTEKDILRGFKISGVHYGYSHFNPLWIKYFIKKYNVTSIYDPCGGWGHRLLGAWGIEYHYNDLSKEIYNNVLLLNDFVSGFVKGGNKTFTNEDATLFISSKKYHSVFTCPPYYNVEEYPCGKETRKYEIWLEEFWSKVVENCYKSLDNYFCFVISKKFLKDLLRIAERKFFLIEIVPLKISKSHFSYGNNEAMVVMKKK